MLDVQAVGSDLSPEQQEETLDDLAFFLDEFGSTRAVRVKLQEQESEIKRLKSRLIDEISHQEEEKGENTLVNVVEDVDEIMTHLDFFLKTFGSTRAVREMLQRQKKEIVELRRAVLNVQPRGLKSSLNGDDIPTEAAMLMEHEPFSHRIDDSNAAVKKSESTATLVRPKSKTICRRPGCSKGVQALGLCYSHGGYHNCKVEGCSRRAMTKYLCSYHGGGRRCPVVGCNQRTRPGYKGFCSDHARDQRRNCKAEECRNEPVKRHDELETKRGSSTLPTASDDSGDISIRTFSSSFLHDEMKSNQGVATRLVVSEHPGDKRKSRGCKEPGCQKIGKDHGPKKGYCFRHGGGITCSHPGCTKSRQVRGVCAAHGGFYKCKREECTKRAGYRGYCYGHNRERSKLEEKIRLETGNDIDDY